VAEALVAAGWEVIAHGWTQRGLTADDEAEVIGRSLDRIERATGRRPRCWLGPGLKETMETPDVLARAGITTLFDWTVDDLPLWMATTEGPLLAVPYSLELNDSVVYAVERHATGELERRVAASLDVYADEVRHEGRLVTLGLHPHLMGVPHRVAELRRILDAMAAASSSRFVTGSEIDAWFRAVHPPQDRGRAAPAPV
jgi:peptidoglycan/xylan/chitin deacetylase (PgdA/CDA1 family)